MKKTVFATLTAILLVALMTLTPYATDEADTAIVEEVTAIETVAETTPETTAETMAETTIEDTAKEETATETEAQTEAETMTIGDIVDAEKDRNWILGVIDQATPEEVDKMQEAIENAILGLETEDFGGWDWAYKLVKDNAHTLSLVAVGLGLLVTAIVGIVKVKRDKTLNHNVIVSTETAHRLCEENKKVIEGYSAQIEELTKAVGELMAEVRAKDEIIAKLTAEETALVKQEMAEHEASKNASVLLADIVYDLIEMSNIPRVKKDALFTRHETAKKRIAEEGVGDAETN